MRNRSMEISINIRWILLIALGNQFVYAVNLHNGNDAIKKSVKNPRSGSQNWAPRPPPNQQGSGRGQPTIARQPPPGQFPPMQGQGPFPQGFGGGAPFQNPNPWQGQPFPGNGPLGPPPNFPQMGNNGPIGNSGWGPPMGQEWNGGPQQAPLPGPGFGQPPNFWPQPSQWPFVETAGPPPQGNPGAFRWGQGPPPAQLPPMNSGGPPPWQAPVPAVYSQYLPTTLGAAGAPPSPPWSAPGTMFGGPQLSPQGPWSSQPIGYNPSSGSGSNNVNRPNQPGVPAYIRTGYDSANAVAAASQSNRNANPFSRTNQNQVATSPRFAVPESQTPILEPYQGNIDWQRPAPPGPPSSQTPLGQNQNFNLLPPRSLPPNFPPFENGNQNFEVPFGYPPSNLGTFDYPSFQGQIQNPNHESDSSNDIPFVRGRDAHNFEMLPDEERMVAVDDTSSLATTQSPTPQPTDDPFALNPNIIFGGPASITFPELTIGMPGGGFSDAANNPNGTSLSVSSIRIGDILSFPQGTRFGVVPPPPLSIGQQKKLTQFNARTRQDDADHLGIDKSILEHPRKPPIIDSQEQAKSEGSKETRALASVPVLASAPLLPPPPPPPQAPILEVMPNKNDQLRAPKGLKLAQNVRKNSANTLTDAILRQIQELKVVLYGRANCSVCLETEALLKNYSVPVYFLEPDTTTNGEQMLTIVQQMTHSVEIPLTFICGRFVGGHQRLYDLHVNQQITALLRECLPSKRRSSLKKGVDRN